MIYLSVKHTNDEDEDLFSFSSIEKAVKYIEEENLVEWFMSDTIVFYMEDDYTYIN